MGSGASRVSLARASGVGRIRIDQIAQAHMEPGHPRHHRQPALRPRRASPLRSRRHIDDDKRNRVTRIVVGAAASGVKKILLSRDSFRTLAATEALTLDVECELLETSPGHGVDSQRAALAMKDAGCARSSPSEATEPANAITQCWRGVVPFRSPPGRTRVSIRRGGNRRRPARTDRIRRLPLEEGARRAKAVEVKCEDGRENLALIDVNDHPGSLLQADPEKPALLTRAEPASVGLSPVGGLVMPCFSTTSSPSRSRPGLSRIPRRAGSSTDSASTRTWVSKASSASPGAEVRWTGPSF